MTSCSTCGIPKLKLNIASGMRTLRKKGMEKGNLLLAAEDDDQNGHNAHRHQRGDKQAGVGIHGIRGWPQIRSARENRRSSFRRPRRTSIGPTISYPPIRPHVPNLVVQSHLHLDLLPENLSISGQVVSTGLIDELALVG